VASVCLSISSSRAFAVDWSANASLSETTELNDNQFLRSNFAGGTLGSYSTITANASARTPTSRLDLNGDVTYNKYWGPGAVGALTETYTGGMRAHYETFDQYANRQYLDTSWRTASTSLAILSDLGIQTQAAGNIDTTALLGGLERSLSASDFVSLSGGSVLTYFDPSSGGTQFLDTTANLNWRHRLSSLASFSIASGAEWLSYDNARQTNTIILRNTAAFDLAVTPLIDVHASAGAAIVQVNQRAILGTPIELAPFSTSPVILGSGAVVGFIGDMSIIYRILKSTTLTLTAAQSVGPSVVGSLFETDAIRAGLTYAINPLSSLALSASISRLTGGGVSDFISATIGYNRALTREWNASLTYRYLHRSATSGTTSGFDPVTGFPVITGNAPAASNGVMLTVSRNVSVLPPGN
jgi:hypothetical protein